nr:unnamed protein product [Callosobruchus analis]
MGRNKRRRSSTSSSSSSWSSTSGSSSDCEAYTNGIKRNPGEMHVRQATFVKSKKRLSKTSFKQIVRMDVHERPRPSTPRNGQETAGTSYIVPHIRDSTESDADPVVPSNSSNIPVERFTDVAERQQQRIGQLEDLGNQLLQNESDKYCTKVTVNPNCISEFNPSNENESCARWLDKIDQLAHINQWDEKVVIYHMQSRPTLKTIFWVKYPGETWTEYYFAKQLLRKCQISGQNAVAMIRDCISDITTQPGAKVRRYASLEDLYREYLSTLEYTRTRHRRTNSYTKPDFLRKTDKYRPEHLKHSLHKSDTNRKMRKNCYNCVEFGHMQTHCPKGRLGYAICKKLGHSVEKCFRNKNNRSKSNEHKTLMCDIKDKSKMNGYYVDCSINGHLLKGLLILDVRFREAGAKFARLGWVDRGIC